MKKLILKRGIRKKVNFMRIFAEKRLNTSITPKDKEKLNETNLELDNIKENSKNSY